MKSGSFKYFGAAIGATAIWGAFSVPLRGLQGYQPHEIINYRLLFSLAITCLIIALFRKKAIRADYRYLKSVKWPKRLQLFRLVFMAGMFLTGNWISFLYAVNHISLKSAAFGYMICPLSTAMGGFFILKEQLSVPKVIAIVIAMISVILLAQGSTEEVLWSTLIAISYSCYLLLQRVITKLDKLNVLGIQLILSTLIIVPSSAYIFGTWSPAAAEPHFWISMVVISILFTVIPLVLVSYSLIGIPSSTLGIIVYLNPIIAFSLAFIYFNEEINVEQLYAYSLLLASVIIFNWDLIGNYLNKYTQKEELPATQSSTPVNRYTRNSKNEPLI